MRPTRRGVLVLAAAIATVMCVTPGDGSADVVTEKPKTFVIPIEYGAQEDMISCPGTPGSVLAYTSLADGGALVECAYPR